MLNFKRAICYSGYRHNQSPATCDYPSEKEILEDLLLVEKDFDCIRMYDPQEHAVRVLKVIKENNLKLKVMLGMDVTAEYNNYECAWIQNHFTENELLRNIARNEHQLRTLIALANKYEDIVEYVSCGNEVIPTWQENVAKEERLVYFAKELKKHCKQPVTYCDGFDIYLNHIPNLVKELDFFSLHIYPQWMSLSCDESIPYFNEKFLECKKAYPNKEMCITETGWTSCSNNPQIISSEANVANQEKYVTFITKWAKENNVLVYLFEAFDEPWKGSSNLDEPEKHWGIYDVNRKPKWDFNKKIYK